MESVDRGAMAKALYPALRAASGLSARGIANVIAASAEGYAFPTNLDRDPPITRPAEQCRQVFERPSGDRSWG